MLVKNSFTNDDPMAQNREKKLEYFPQLRLIKIYLAPNLALALRSRSWVAVRRSESAIHDMLVYPTP